MNFPTYRQQSLLVAGGYPLELLMGQVYSNELDPMAGRQLPVLHASRDYGYFTVSGNLGTQYVQAVGWAMANALMGDGSIAAAWIGDGATAASDFHSALVTASAYQPPVILNIVNNQWAISTYTGVATGASHTYAERVLGYGIPALRVDGNDYLAVLAASQWAVERTRKGYGPVGIEWFTYRAAAHSSSDDPSGYRPKNEAEAWPLGDPIERLKQHLIQRGDWSEAEHEATLADTREHVAKIQKTVEARGTLLDQKPQPPEAIFDGVYAEMPAHLQRQKQQLEQQP
jgi:2-oxoisovalerate dehydrogenase E1 component alpha subunit